MVRLSCLALGVLLALAPLAQAGQLQRIERDDDKEALPGTVSSLTTQGPWAAPWQIGEWTLRGVNYERLIRGLPMLQFDPTLTEAAERHSQDMAARGFFAHITPGGQNLEERLKLNGVHGWRIIAENLAIHYDWLAPVSAAIHGWMMSPGHKQNILDARFRYTGIGVAYGANGSLYFTQIFLNR
jgi:uncharacterized protein YkwD